MVTRYDIISGRWSSHFWVKMHVLSTFFNNKRKTCQWNDVKGLFKCYFTREVQKIIIYRDFNLISNSWWDSRWRPLLVTSQASSSATTHKIYLILLRRSKAFHWRQNRFEILQHIKNSVEGFYPPSSPTLCTTVGVWICVYVRGLTLLNWFELFVSVICFKAEGKKLKRNY